jgi:hypothetical protein
MSNPPASNETSPPIDPKIGLILTAAEHLIPLFQSSAIDIILARKMAFGAIEAYRPETRADFVNVARTIAFSMAALALLGQAASQDMTMPKKMRAFGRANALNRSADQSERTMMQRRRYQQANPTTAQPDLTSAPPAPDEITGDAQMQAEIAEAMKEYLAACTQANAKAAVSETMQKPAPAASKTVPPHLPRVAMPVAPAVTAIGYGGPKSDNGQPGRTPFKEGLLQHSAMRRVAAENGAQYLG